MEFGRTIWPGRHSKAWHRSSRSNTSTSLDLLAGKEIDTAKAPSGVSVELGPRELARRLLVRSLGSERWPKRVHEEEEEEKLIRAGGARVEPVGMHWDIFRGQLQAAGGCWMASAVQQLH